jgi:hypothetical protein
MSSWYHFHQSVWGRLRGAPKAEGEKWNSAYNDIVADLHRFRKGKLFSENYLCFRGWDEHLSFDEDQLPEDFDIDQHVFVAECEELEETCMTWQFAEDCFISVTESGDYFGILNSWWKDAFDSEEDAKHYLEEAMRDKQIAHIYY